MNPIPQHIAIIMDGNGRWAKSKKKPRIEGHKKGIEAVEEITISAREAGIKFLTLYAFSDENWERPVEEVQALMNLLIEFLRLKRQKMIDNGIKFLMIGDSERLPDEVLKEVDATKKATSSQTGMTLLVALSYGARGEICRAVNRAIKAGIKEFEPEILSKYLDTIGIPDPDLLVRTSGEVRISNFLLWQLAYTEFYFTDTMWPDFSKNDLLLAIESYRGRERRFGKTSEQL